MSDLPAPAPTSTSAAATSAAEHAALERTPRSVRILKGLGRFAVRQPLGFVGALIIIVFVFVALTAPWITPHDPFVGNLRARFAPTGGEYLLGTDQLGRDVLSRLMYGARLSLFIAFGAVVFSGILATALGMISAYAGGWVDNIMQRFVDAFISLPDLIILITLLGIARTVEGINMIWAMLFALAIIRVAPATRYVRGLALEIRARPFIEAAQASGASGMRVVFRHVLPNVFPQVLIISTIVLPAFILLEASLSFLGFGPTGEPSWGQMLSADGREFFRRQPGLAIWPGVCITLIVFAFNMFGDAIRDVLDPRLRGSR